MAQFKRISRAEAIDFLNSSENWRSLRRNNRRIAAPSDMATSTLRRYANGLRRIEARGGWVHDLAELRGHTASEHHTGRGRKKGFENWQPPERIRRRYNELISFTGKDRANNNVHKYAWFTVTAGESVAVRALNQAIMDGNTIAMTLTGPLPDQKKSIFWRGGYDPKLLLAAAGYRVSRTGRYVKAPGASLERWLVNYIARMQPSPTTERWPLIALYQIYAADRREGITEVDLVPPDGRVYRSMRHRGPATPDSIAPNAWPSWVKSHGRKA